MNKKLGAPNNGKNTPHFTDVNNQLIADGWIYDVHSQTDKLPHNPEKNDSLINEEQAQQQLLHALLIAHHTDKEKHHLQQEKRIKKVLAAIDGEVESKSNDELGHNSKPSGSGVFHASWMSLAAAVCVVMITLSIVFIPNKNALAEINELIVHMQSLGDRLYTITVEPLAPLSPETKPPNRTTNNSGRSYRKSASDWLDNAQIYMRSDHSYLIISDTSKGKRLKARTHAGNWKIEHDNTLLESDDKRVIKLPLGGNAASMAFMDLPVLLTTLQDNYNVSYQDKVALAFNSEGNKTLQSLSLITADKKYAGTKGVKKISIFYNANSYLIEKIIFERVHLQGESAKYRVSLQLESTQPLAADFFEAQYHLEN